MAAAPRIVGRALGAGRAAVAEEGAALPLSGPQERLDEWLRAGCGSGCTRFALAAAGSGAIEWSRAIADSTHVHAKEGAARRARARLIEAETAASTISSSTRPMCARSRSAAPAAPSG